MKNNKEPEKQPLDLLPVIAACKLEVKHLAPYLPYDLQMICGNLKIIMKGLQVVGDEFRIYDELGNDRIKTAKSFKPVLRPMSDVTKIIEHDGETFRPIEKLNQIAFGCLFGISSDEDIISGEIVEFYYWEYQELIIWHFDVFGLIKKGLAIDRNTIDNV